MTWLLLVVAGFVEITWALSLKPTNGFTRLWPTVLSIVLMFAAVYLLALAMRSLPVGTAYAVFTGIGSVGTVLFGIIVAGDPPSPTRLGPIALILTGIILLRLFSDH